MNKRKYTQLAAVAALSLMFGATASVAQTERRPAKSETEVQSGDARSSSRPTRTQVQSDQDIKQSRKTSVRSSSKETSSDRDSRRSRETVKVSSKKKIVVKHRDRDRFYVIGGTRPRTTVAFVVLGSRHHYRPGWCRGLHRGTHWAPGLRWHSGRHVGLFRC